MIVHRAPKDSFLKERGEEGRKHPMGRAQTAGAPFSIPRFQTSFFRWRLITRFRDYVRIWRFILEYLGCVEGRTRRQTPNTASTSTPALGSLEDVGSANILGSWSPEGAGAPMGSLKRCVLKMADGRGEFRTLTNHELLLLSLFFFNFLNDFIGRTTKKKCTVQT